MYPVLCFVAVLTVGASAICDNACKLQQRASLETLYQSLDGQHWARREGWKSGSLDHCSWAGVHCCASQDTGNGPFERSGVCPLPGGVVGLELPLNNATGPWPAAALAGLADSLAYLNLRGNNLHGQLPASVSDLSQLSVLYVDSAGLSGSLPAELGQLLNLTQLSASGNSFSGPIPESLGSLQRLRRLGLHDNQLTGQFPASLLSLPQLQQLDVSCNQLSWQLPNSRMASEMVPLDAFEDAILAALAAPPSQISQVNFSTNKLSGPIPTSVALLSTMMLDLSNNQLSGSIPAAAIGSNQVLQELLLRHNRLSGTLSADLFRGNLQVLDLSSNALTGTLPAVFGIGGSIVQLDLSNNSLAGPLPNDVRSQLGSLQWLNLAGNRLTPLPQGLPNYLRIDSSAPAAAVDPSSRPGLVCQPVVSTGSSSAVIQLDPATYGYEGCTCQAPFHPVVQQEGGRIVNIACVANQQGSTGVPLAHVLGPLLAVLAAALVALVLVGAAWRGGLAGLVQRITVDSEKKMPPSAAKDITLVLTDVQGSTELWEWDQQLASDAFKVHDRILRQYMTQFYGYEVSTEGDAFLVAFHEPFDAVAWCLCVQLALHYADWAEPLLLHKSTCIDTAETLELKRRERQARWQNRMTRAAAAAPGSAYAQAAAAAASATRRLSRTTPAPGAAAVDPADPTGGGDDHVPDTLPPAPLVAVDQDPGAAFDDDCAEGSSSDNALEERMAAEYAALSSGKAGGRNLLFRGLRVRMSIATGGVDSVRLHSVTQRAEYVGEVLRKVQAVGETPQGGQVMMDSDTFRGIHARLPELGGVVLEATQKLLHNNRAAGPNAQELVDMFSQMPPVATNSEAMHRNDFIGRSSPTTNDSANPVNHNAAHSTITVMPAVAENSDNGANGRASNDGAAGAGANGTAGLGAQQHGWSHTEQLHSAEVDVEKGRMNASPAPRAQRGLLHQAAALLGLRDDDSVSSSIEGLHGAAGSAQDSPPPPHPDSPKGRNMSGIGSTIGTGVLGFKGRRRGRQDGDGRAVRRRSSLSYGVMVIDMGVHQLSGLPQKVNLIQAMPCGLEDRARFFSRLDSLRQETPGYFDAPAAGLAPLSPGANTAGITMPTVTIVFCTVDKYCEIVEVNREAAELALELYSDCVRWLLLVGGGYECQEAEGTFMVAFSSADVAIEWCLMVQQVLRDMSWPASVLELPTCEEERDMHGNIMFRGPRVKMGIYSGTPTRVIPHTTTGRADYFGPLVNRAARYCHAAARGGQVLVPKELMCEVISKWVLIDPTELMQSDRLLELVAYFDEERRLWPWMFKRRTHWDVPMPPQLYPHLPASQMLPAEDAATSAGTGLAVSQQQQQQGRWWGPGERAGAAANTHDAVAAGGIVAPGGAASRQQPSDAAAAGVSAAGVSGKEQHGNAEGVSAADELVKSSSDASSQNHSSLSDLMPVRLAPLHEAAECSSSKCPSEGDPPIAPVTMSPGVEQQHIQPQQQTVSDPTVPGLPPIHPRQSSSVGVSLGYEPMPGAVRGVRRHSDLAQAVSRLGPQALQQLQLGQYSSGQYSQLCMTPVGVQSSGNSVGFSLPYSPAGWRPAGPVAPATVAAALVAQQSRYRRPSYLSDISASARYRRYSNMSDSSSVQYSSAGATMSSGTGFAGAGGWGGVGGGPSSRRNSAMSDFFPVGHHSRRPSSQMSADGTGCLSPPGSAGLDISTAAAAVQQGLPLSDRPRVQQQLQQPWQQQQQHLLQPYPPASPRSGQQQQQQIPYYQHQQQQQFQMHQRGALVGQNAYPGQPAALPGLAATHQQSAKAAAGTSGATSAYPVAPQQQQQLQAAGDYVSEAANSQQQSSAAAAVAYQGRKGNVAQGGVRFAQPQLPVLHSGPSSLPGVTDSAQNSATLSNPMNSTSTGSRGSGGGRPVPAAVLLQGLESQVLPGMLHSSNRLRLVSKRRRQMSYCFFQESSKPGVPAEGADPKRLLPAGYGGSGGVGMGHGGVPASNYAGSEAATSVNGDRPGQGLIALGSIASSQGGQGYLSGPPGPMSVTGAPTSVGSGGAGGAGVSRRGSGRSNSNCGSGMAESNLGSGDDGAAPAASTSCGLGGEFASGAQGCTGGTPVASRLDESGRLQPGEDAAAGAAADAASAPALGANWAGGSNAVMDGLCGLPEIEPLPDADVMESLRLSVPQRGHRPSSMSTATGVTDSVAGFEGPSIGNMCADIMRGRWLWIGELLVHDLGQFKFKGVAGVHSIVSVTSEELGGRTFPTTIRRGKGEQIRLGRGLLALVQMLPTQRSANWMGPYQGQQLLQNPAPPLALSEVQHQPLYSPAGNMCQACGGMGGATNPTGQPINHPGVSTGLMKPGEGSGLLHMDPNCSMQGSQNNRGELSGGLQRGPYGSGSYGSAVAAAFTDMPGRMRRGGSLGDLRAAHTAAATAAAQYGSVGSVALQHYASAPESDATSALEAATGAGTLSAASSFLQGPSRGFTTGTTATPADIRSAGSSSIGQYHAGWHEDEVIAAALPHCVHPLHTPSQAAQQFWHMQTHLWQLQLQQQQQRQRQRQQQRRRRHSVCMGSMQSRFWTRPYGVMGEMMPFLETEEWPAPGSVSLPSPTPDQQQSEPQLVQASGSMVDVSFADLVPHFPPAHSPNAAAVAELSRAHSAGGSVAAGAGVSPFAANSSSVIDDDDALHTSDIGSVMSDVMDASRAKAASRHSHSASTAASARDEPNSAR